MLFEPAFTFYYVLWAMVWGLIIGGWLIVTSLVITAIRFRAWAPLALAAVLSFILLNWNP